MRLPFLRGHYPDQVKESGAYSPLSAHNMSSSGSFILVCCAYSILETTVRQLFRKKNPAPKHLLRRGTSGVYYFPTTGIIQVSTVACK